MKSNQINMFTDKEKTSYQLTGHWDEVKIGKVMSVLKKVDSPYLLQYRNMKYTPPETEMTGYVMKKRVIKKPGELSFESDSFCMTLQDYLEMQPDKTLNGDKAMSIISQVWMGMNALRSYSPTLQIFCLDPSHIVLVPLPESDPPMYQVQICSYIPVIFFATLNPTQRRYCSQIPPNQKNIGSASLETFAHLVTRIWTGYHPLIPNSDHRGQQTIPIPNPLVQNLVDAILIRHVGWEYTYTDEYLSLARKVTFHEFRSKPHDFSLIETLGRGTSATVFQALQKTRRGARIVAVKEIKVTDDDLDFIQNEVDIMTLCQHENVLTLYDSFTHHGSIFQNIDGFFANVVIEFCDGGTLQSFFDAEYPLDPLPDYLVSHVLSGILKGLWYLHSEHHIVHRDLKPENILLKVDPSNLHSPIIKIADFGLSKIVENHQMLESYVGTPVFMAPEVFMMQKYNYKCDLWSLGGLLYYLRTHTYPLSSNRQRFMANMQNQIPPTYQPSFWSSVEGLRDLVSNLIVYNKNYRYDWVSIHKHPYAKNLIDQDIPYDYSKL
ncbi:myosin light chain kinase [Entamoeba marina]